MQTYKYHLPVKGSKDTIPVFTASMLKDELIDGSDCLMAYCIFPTDSAIVDYVDFDIDKEDITAINLHTYTQLWEGMESDLKDCLQTNLAKIAPNLVITGDIEALGLEGSIPDVLYHITERGRLSDIMKEGLTPDIGRNNYKNMEKQVSLTDKKDVAPWLCILKHLDDPVILEVDTRDVTSIETGRVFKDRSYVPEGYGEYRSKDIIPVSAVSQIALGENQFTKDLKAAVIKQVECSKTADEFEEVKTGMKRLEYLGLMNESEVQEQIAKHADTIISSSDKTSKEQSSTWVIRNGVPVKVKAADQKTEPEEGLPWDKEELPWKEPEKQPQADEPEDDFTKAVRQMDLSDFGINMNSK